jgi:hypothetical protein
VRKQVDHAVAHHQADHAALAVPVVEGEAELREELA